MLSHQQGMGGFGSQSHHCMSGTRASNEIDPPEQVHELLSWQSNHPFTIIVMSGFFGRGATLHE